MATFNSTDVANSVPLSSHGFGGTCKVKRAQVALTTAVVTTDTINFFDLPNGARIHLAILESDDLDSNGSPTITINVGDAGSATRLFSASTVAQAGTLSTAIATAGADYVTTAKTRIVGALQANAATATAGNVYLTVFYSVEGVAS